MEIQALARQKQVRERCTRGKESGQRIMVVLHDAECGAMRRRSVALPCQRRTEIDLVNAFADSVNPRVKQRQALLQLILFQCFVSLAALPRIHTFPALDKTPVNGRKYVNALRMSAMFRRVEMHHDAAGPAVIGAPQIHVMAMHEEILVHVRQ